MAYCDRCDRYFPHDRALEQHERGSNNGNHNWCWSCDLDFASFHGLEEHWIQSPRHYYCQYHDAQQHFDSAGEYNRHMERDHWWCAAHRRTFNNQHGLSEHYRQHHEHPYCELCNEYCIETDLADHARSDHFHCEECAQFFKYASGLENHRTRSHHYCDECDRFFKSAANLDAHMQSRVHKDATFLCPGARCGRAFVKFSDLVQHAEAGRCPSGITRQMLNNEAIRRDTNRLITNPSRLITYSDGSVAPRSSVTTQWATSRSWNGSMFECFLCHREYRSLAALNQHLQSTAHADKIYRCPNARCANEYAALSSLVQHVEGGSCGVRQFSQVKSAFESIEASVRRLALTG